MTAGGGIVQVAGGDLDALRKALRTIDKDLPRQIVPPALKDAAETLYLRRARDEAPVGTPADYAGRRRPAPGRLRHSVRVLASQRRVALAAGRKSLPYHQPVYWGWPGHNIAPNRFLERAVASVPTARLVGRIEQQLTADIAKRGLEVT